MMRAQIGGGLIVRRECISSRGVGVSAVNPNALFFYVSLERVVMLHRPPVKPLPATQTQLKVAFPLSLFAPCKL